MDGGTRDTCDDDDIIFSQIEVAVIVTYTETDLVLARQTYNRIKSIK